MDMKVLKKTVEKIVLRETMTLEQLYEFMMQNHVGQRLWNFL